LAKTADFEMAIDILLPDWDAPGEGTLVNVNLGQRLLAVGADVRRFLETRRLTKAEREGLTLAEVAIRQAASLAKALEKAPTRRPAAIPKRKARETRYLSQA
jgi:hypothetical protein